MVLSDVVTVLGSSPRAWGAGVVDVEVGRVARIISTSVGSGRRQSCRRTGPRDHPHERGERVHREAFARTYGGSSPRAWGADEPARARHLPVRIIPTSVGSGCTWRRGTRPGRDHPHERGERRTAAQSMGSSPGSSPRAWGAEVSGGGEVLGVGIIPTSVGSGCSRRRGRSRSADHPHERGERLFARDRTVSVWGSSPRAWGAAGGRVVLAGRGGIIPTSVGSGRRPWPLARPGPDHPHERGERERGRGRGGPSAGSSPRAWGAGGARFRVGAGPRIIPTSVGERVSAESARDDNYGSSPRAWGAGPCRRPRRTGPGIIPTSVGSGVPPVYGRRPTADHPHERGERPRQRHGRGDRGGSSPRAWGAGAWGRGEGARRWIIPTSVGSGSAPPPPSPTPADHPHERGERWTGVTTHPARTGSSPRAWGAARTRRARGARGGIIPTSVGSGARGPPARSPGRDHPHERGERADWSKTRDPRGGSSPRAWGAADFDVLRGVRPGIIPTSVGSGRTACTGRASGGDHPHERGERSGAMCQRRSKGDHPHERGERYSPPASDGRRRGSSPRAWGAGRVAPRIRVGRGIIPTSVGSGPRSPTARRSRRDHPHERGERLAIRPKSMSTWGSSPRAWGAADRRGVDGLDVGIIPTSVGSGGPPTCSRWSGWDHPHERGERPSVSVESARWPGSSPRAWGAARGGVLRALALRIIPTSVGSGGPPRPGTPGSGDHPHERGERRLARVRSNAVTGSSPRAWGAGEVGHAPGLVRGIIPTSVGSGTTSRSASSSSRDHPHERGERPECRWVEMPGRGSSPRAWGAEPCRGVRGDGCGIIPTSVGSGRPPSRRRPWPPDHPHERGERATSGASWEWDLGSSPRAWGAAAEAGRRLPVFGIIPTSVGSGASSSALEV